MESPRTMALGAITRARPRARTRETVLPLARDLDPVDLQEVAGMLARHGNDTKRPLIAYTERFVERVTPSSGTVEWKLGRRRRGSALLQLAAADPQVRAWAISWVRAERSAHRDAQLVADYLPYGVEYPGDALAGHPRLWEALAGAERFEVTPDVRDDGYRVTLEFTAGRIELIVGMPWGADVCGTAQLGDTLCWERLPASLVLALARQALVLHEVEARRRMLVNSTG